MLRRVPERARLDGSILRDGAILVGPLALWMVTAPVGNCEAVQVHGAGCDPAIGQSVTRSAEAALNASG